MKNIVIVLLLVVALALGLAAAKPDEASFHRHLAKVDRQDDGGLLEEAGETVTRAQAKLTADYHDHLLWATVEATRGGTERRWLGVMGIWFELTPGADR